MMNATVINVAEDVISNLLGDEMFHDMVTKLVEDEGEFSEDENEEIVTKVIELLSKADALYEG